MQSRMLITV